MPSTGIATTIDLFGEDLLENIIARLPASSFASAACVNRSWNLVSDRILCRPKLSSAWSINPSLQVAVEDVANKVLLEPIRPHFAIVFVGRILDKQQAHQLITAKLGSKVPVITNWSRGIIGRDVISDEFREIDWKTNDRDADTSVLVMEYVNRAIMLIVGFLPGIKVKIVSLPKQTEAPQAVVIDKFVTDIREFSASISGCKSPSAIIMFSEIQGDAIPVLEKLDYALSPETVIVGDCYPFLRHDNRSSRNIKATEEHASAAALVFVVDRNKPPGIGEIQFDAVISNGLLTVGDAYKVASVKEGRYESLSLLTARREGSREILDGETIKNQIYEELGHPNYLRPFCIGVRKRRKCSIGQEKVGWVTSFSFHQVRRSDEEGLIVDDRGIKTGDTFRYYYSDFATALSSAANVSNDLRSLKQGSNTGGDKREVFGGLIFTSSSFCDTFFTQPKICRAPFTDNFPGVTLGGSCSYQAIGRGDLILHVKDSQEQKMGRCCLPKCSAVYFIMSYTP
ncbi:putative F-box domain-containing protein [Helianthus anomalus]